MKKDKPIAELISHSANCFTVFMDGEGKEYTADSEVSARKMKAAFIRFAKKKGYKVLNNKEPGHVGDYAQPIIRPDDPRVRELL